MPAPHSFEFATIRVVPRVERGEFINAGVIVFCLAQKFLQCRFHVDAGRLQALSPETEVADVRQHLEAFQEVCAGTERAGPVGKLSQRERFLWLVAPRSTIIQISPVHSGLCDSPEMVVKELFQRLVLPLSSTPPNPSTA